MEKSIEDAIRIIRDITVPKNDDSDWARALRGARDIALINLSADELNADALDALDYQADPYEDEQDQVP
jgi:DNA-binding response OmpR family regulator